MADIAPRIFSAWHYSGSRPVISGDPRRSVFEIAGFQVGDRIVKRDSLPVVNLTDPLAVTLASRAIAELGTSEPWEALYRN